MLFRSDLAAGEVFRAARRDRSLPARTVVRVAVGVDRSADASLSATGSLVAPVEAALPRRGAVLAGADASAGAADDAAPASDSAVSAAATPAPEIRADPTPTITAPVPSKARRSPMPQRLSLANRQTVPRPLATGHPISPSVPHRHEVVSRGGVRRYRMAIPMMRANATYAATITSTSGTKRSAASTRPMSIPVTSPIRRTLSA